MQAARVDKESDRGLQAPSSSLSSSAVDDVETRDTSPTASATSVAAAVGSGQPVNLLPANVMGLQSIIGNQSIGRLLQGRFTSPPRVQARLKVGAVHDPLEAEADRAASTVLSSMEPGITGAPPVLSQALAPAAVAAGPAPDAQLSALPGPLQRTSETSATPAPPASVGAGTDTVAGTGGEFEVQPHLEARLATLSGGGQPLPAAERSFFEPRFGQDFGQVRLHTGSEAASLAQAVGAQAFTLGREIVFDQGEFQAGTSGGRELLAHELAHVVQQGETAPIQRQVQRKARSESGKDEDIPTAEAPVSSSATAQPTLSAPASSVTDVAKSSPSPKLSFREAFASAQQEITDQEVNAETAPALAQGPVSLKAAPATGGDGASGEGGGGAAGGSTASGKTVTPGPDALPTEAAGQADSASRSGNPLAGVENQKESDAQSGPAGLSLSSVVSQAQTASVGLAGAVEQLVAELPGAELARSVLGQTRAILEPGGAKETASSQEQPASVSQATAREPAASQPGLSPSSESGGSKQGAADPGPSPSPEQEHEATPAQTLAAAREPASGAAPAEDSRDAQAPASALKSANQEGSTQAAAPQIPGSLSASELDSWPGGVLPKGPERSDSDDELLRKIPTLRRRANGRALQRKPSTRSPQQDPAFQAVTQQVKGVAAQEKVHPQPQQKAQEASAAARMPPEEKKGLAQDQQAGAITAAASAQSAKAAGGSPPGFDKATFVSAVKGRIDALTPSDPHQMENIESSGVFGRAKGAVDEKVRAGKQAAQGDVDDKAKEAPNTGAIPDKPVEALKPNTPGPAPAAPAAGGAAPKSKSSGEVETPLAQGPQVLDAQMAQARITDEQLSKSNEPQFQQSLKAREEVVTNAQKAPATFRAGERGTLAGAEQEADALVQARTAAMHVGRTGAMTQLDALQGTGKGKDEGARSEIGRSIDGIYNRAKSEVEGILTAMEGAVDQTFNAGADAAKTAAVSYINRETRAYKDRRYAANADSLKDKAAGLLHRADDFLTDMPPEYYEYFRIGRDSYVAEMEKVLNSVADIVGDHLGRARQRIEQGRKEITDYIARQPKELQAVARETAQGALEKFNELESDVDSKADELIDSLAQKYVEKLGELDAELEKLKAETEGLLNKAKDAMGETIGTILELKAMLEGILAKAAGAIDKILEDPIQFLNNLLTAVKGGLEGFAANIGTHLQQGLMSWLTGTLSAAGLQMPAQFDLAGIFSLVMQVLGLTWTNIRTQIVRALGPDGEAVVAGLEATWDVLQAVRTQGLAGLWEFVKDMVGDLKSMVIDTIKDIVMHEVVQAGIKWVVGMLGGPAGAFVKAVEAIVKVIGWIKNNAARVLALVNSVVDSIAAIANGDTGGASKFIENSLARALPMVISFLAELIGLGDLPAKIQGVIEKIQAPINVAIQWLVKKAQALAKSVLAKLGGRGKDERETTAHSGPDERTREEKQADLDAAISEAELVLGSAGATPASVESAIPAIKNTHRLTSLSLVKLDESSYHVEGKVNPGRVSRDFNLGADEAELEEAAQKEAAGLIEVASKEAPFVASILSGVANQNGGRMTGLANQVKSQESLARKIADRARPYVRKLGVQAAIAKASEKINDVLRYTIEVDYEKYAAVYHSICPALEGQGFKIEKSFNAWTLAGTDRDIGYRGINVTFVAPSGQIFEIQFHTPESYNKKMELHPFYEEWRRDTTSKSRREQVLNIMVESLSEVPTPEGVKDI